MLVPSCLATNLGSKCVVDAVPRPVIAPLGVVEGDALPFGILVWQHPPLAATHDDVQDGIDHRVHIECARATTRLCQRNYVLDTIPLTVGQVGWICFVLHTQSLCNRRADRHSFLNRLSGQWARAILVNDPVGPILLVFGVDLASSDGYKNMFDIYLEADGVTLGVTGLCTWETWTLRDLREATPDEAEAQTHRCLNL
jgi:hypothetical protein